MFTTEKCCRIEPSLKNLSEEEVILVEENYREMVRLAIESFKKNKKGSKNP